MSVSAAELASTHQAWLDCLNEKRWDDLQKYVNSKYIHGRQELTPEGFVTHIQNVSAAIGVSTIHVDTMLIDEKNQCVADILYTKINPTIPFLSPEPTGRELMLREFRFVWFKNGKFSKATMLVNSDDLRKQMTDPDYHHELDLVSEWPTPTGASRLSKEELEAVFRGYVDTAVARRTDSDLADYIHAELTFNKNVLALDDYRKGVVDLQTAIPDLQVQVEALVVQEETQRVAARLLISGTPVAEWGGLATGRAMVLPEHSLYQVVDGKIQQVFSIGDLDSAKQSQQQP
ncbi:hypothetical protein SLS62_008968 [Diatrype stigma]|uniref:SnoaL-like polyketide cyclase n=1 Tax=Diatrype stigma TaxID=117547 RepID=A0AAN9UIN7_9PEZI